MINNRLFKKINAIFWGILSWLPLVFTILCFFKTSGVQFDTQSDFNYYLDNFFFAFSEINSNANDWISNPLTEYFVSFSELLGVSLGGPIFTVVELISWFCLIQVFRLLAYVFYWFIDLISGLFDYLSLKRKGDE